MLHSKAKMGCCVSTGDVTSFRSCSGRWSSPPTFALQEDDEEEEAVKEVVVEKEMTLPILFPKSSISNNIEHFNDQVDHPDYKLSTADQLERNDDDVVSQMRKWRSYGEVRTDDVAPLKIVQEQQHNLYAGESSRIRSMLPVAENGDGESDSADDHEVVSVEDPDAGEEDAFENPLVVSLECFIFL